METTPTDIFSITEILENVLLCLDIKTLLTSGQRVCHSWHDLVVTSPALQKHLYFQPDWEKRAKTQNPLLSEFFPPWFPPALAATDAKSNQASQELESCSHIQGIFGGNADFENLPLAISKNNPFFMYEKASWRHMLVQQPPIAELVIFKVVANRGGSHFSGPYAQNKVQTDVSFEDLYSQALKENEPLRMDCFYDKVVLTSGSMPYEWMIVWDSDNGKLEIPSVIHSYKFEDLEKEMIKKIARMYGMVLVVSQIRQCCQPFLWTPGEKFVFKKEILKDRDGRKIV
ncbi:hypothetical protein N7478_012256 [Penicillium angulare]|uniref:uncharacterized protein n=1 Tax=Penicillium angulare TaxID=116970 RepID=UPI002541729D|nr:uncharacterized protein N7478_012256 [Penicillium angulare]KAJ5259275.1 hypothetical protein N7478_012256 [Penicillium angulare]